MKKLTIAVKRRLISLKRRQHHPLVHKIHESHKISRKTLFYMKEYGRKSHIASVILKESLLALILAFVVGIVGGVSLEKLEPHFMLFLPLIILLPALNDMNGDYSMIMVSRLSTLAFTKGAIRNWWMSKDVRKIIQTVISVALLSAVYVGIVASVIAYLKGFSLNTALIVKVVQVSLITTLVMVSVIMIISAFGVFYVYKRKEDPNNLVMPLMTSIADLGTILIFALVVNLTF